ncbi:hypothetical protein [Nostoc sp.]|uniref:hypothetical protein n=1 Tax=Nostoc sp. TaxID=1180 RepID=UPI002FFB597B
MPRKSGNDLPSRQIPDFEGLVIGCGNHLLSIGSDGGIYRVISSTFTLRRSIAAIFTLQPSQQVETP